MKKIKEFIIKCWKNDVLRYIFFGGCTTLVNLACFYILRRTTRIPRDIVNTISVVAAILFAYFVNSRFVFESRADNFKDRFKEFVKFISARLSTLIIEVGGVWLLVGVLKLNEFLIKTIIIQIIVLVLNYIFSKFLVFTKKEKKAGEDA
ncbi:MAG: GtrA family protein [Roseburia sp.]|nr:GtrA family protein [Roseburia sp.]